MYEDANTGTGQIHRTVHDNDEETHVVVYHPEDGDWVVVAVDVSPDLEPLASEVVAVCATEDEAHQRAERWMAANEKGILGGDGSSGGVLDKVNEWGEELVGQ